MDLKKEDFILVTVLDGRKVLALRPDYFDEKPLGPIGKIMKEVFENKKAKEVEIIPEPKKDNADALAKARAAKAAKKAAEEEEIAKHLKMEAELAEIEKKELIEKEKKKAELKAQLEALG